MAEHFHSKATHAYILINCEPPHTASVMERLRAIPGAIVHEVLGPYDIVVELEADAPEYITATLRNKIRPINGVTHTVTCTWME